MEKEAESLRATITRFEYHPWLISQEDIDWYQSLVDHVYVLERSPVTYDSSLQVLVKRFLSGAYTAEQFAAACQEHIDMIYSENDITPAGAGANE